MSLTLLYTTLAMWYMGYDNPDCIKYINVFMCFFATYLIVRLLNKCSGAPSARSTTRETYTIRVHGHTKTIEVDHDAEQYNTVSAVDREWDRQIVELGLTKKVDTVFIDGVFDLPHIGHVRLIRLAQRVGKRVIVAIARDVAVEAYKRETYMKFSERMAWVNALMRPTDVVIVSPSSTDPDPELHDGITDEFMDKHKIDLVIHTGSDAVPGEYMVADERQVMWRPQRTPGVSTTELLKRIEQRYLRTTRFRRWLTTTVLLIFAVIVTWVYCNSDSLDIGSVPYIGVASTYMSAFARERIPHLY